MLKRISLSLCLLAGTFCAAPALALTPIANPTVASQTIASATGAAALTEADFPAGFTAISAAQVNSALGEVTPALTELGQKLGMKSISPENIFVLYNESQVILGFTVDLPDASSQAKLDEQLASMQANTAQQALVDEAMRRLTAKLPQGQKVAVGTPQALSFNDLGNSAAGSKVKVRWQNGDSQRAMDLEGIVELAAFRKDSVAGLTAVIYFDGQAPEVQLSDVATKLVEKL